MRFDLINTLKKKKGWTNEDLASASGVPKPTIDKITAGATTNPNFNTIWALAEALGCTIDQFKETKISNTLAEEDDMRLDEIIDIFNKINEQGKKYLHKTARYCRYDPEYEKTDETHKLA